MRRKLIIGFILLNGLIAAALFVTPADSQVFPRGILNCCKEDESQKEPYCCMACCFFTFNCDEDEDCLPTK